MSGFNEEVEDIVLVGEVPIEDCITIVEVSIAIKGMVVLLSSRGKAFIIVEGLRHLNQLSLLIKNATFREDKDQEVVGETCTKKKEVAWTYRHIVGVVCVVSRGPFLRDLMGILLLQVHSINCHTEADVFDLQREF